jgi:hypothetical protein
MDPRVVTPPEGIARMFEISHGSYTHAREARQAQAEIRSLRTQLQAVPEQARQGAIAEAINGLPAKMAAIGGGAEAGRGRRGGGRRGAGQRGGGQRGSDPTFTTVANELRAVMDDVERADAPPTRAAEEGFASASRDFAVLTTRWNEFKTTDLPALNEQLRQANLPAITIRAEPDPDEPPPDFGMLNEDEG